MLETARALSMVVDQQLAAMQASAEALATSPAAVSGDVPAFATSRRRWSCTIIPPVPSSL